MKGCVKGNQTWPFIMASLRGHVHVASFLCPEALRWQGTYMVQSQTVLHLHYMEVQRVYTLPQCLDQYSNKAASSWLRARPHPPVYRRARGTRSRVDDNDYVTKLIVTRSISCNGSSVPGGRGTAMRGAAALSVARLVVFLEPALASFDPSILPFFSQQEGTFVPVRICSRGPV